MPPLHFTTLQQVTIGRGMFYESTEFGFHLISDNQIEKLTINSFGRDLHTILVNTQLQGVKNLTVNRINMLRDEFFGIIVDLFPHLHHADVKSIDFFEVSERMMEIYLQQWLLLETLEIQMFSNMEELCDCLVNYTNIKKLVIAMDHDDMDDNEEVMHTLKTKYNKLKIWTVGCSDI